MAAFAYAKAAMFVSMYLSSFPGGKADHPLVGKVG